MKRLLEHYLIQELLTLRLPADDFVVFGSGPLMAHGLRESRDLDLLARGAAWESAMKQGQVERKDDGAGFISLSGGQIEVFSRWGPGEWDTDKVIDTADLIEGIRFANLEYTLAWKKRLNRLKDRADIELIERFLREHEN